MKHLRLLLPLLTIAAAAFMTACDKKEKSTGITPTYGTTGNPNPNHQTVTGSTTFSNPATNNTSMLVGGIGWANPTCVSTSSILLKGLSGNTDVTLSFASSVQAGIYGISAVASGTNCAMTIVNAPQQPVGVVWIGKSGTVSVQTTSNSINATFANVVCTQQTFDFPVVTATGTLGCSQ